MARPFADFRCAPGREHLGGKDKALRPASRPRCGRPPFFHGMAVLLVFLLFSFPSIPYQCAADAGQSEPRVVILNSYHQGYAWSDRQFAGLLAELHRVYPTLEPSIEHMDTKRFPGEDHMVRLREYLAGKYRGRKIDLLVTMDNPALELALSGFVGSLSGVPTVFEGVNDFRPEMLKGKIEVTGVAEILDAGRTLELALELHPRAGKVLVIHDYTLTGLAVRRELEQMLPAFQGLVEIEFLPPASFQEVVERLNRASPDTIGLINSFTTDRTGQSLPLSESTRLFTSGTDIPVYGVHESRLGHGIVGGILLDGRVHGRRAGQIALRVLAGEPPSRIPVDFTGTSRPMFDFVQLNRFGIPLSALPEESVIINRPESFYEKHPGIVLGVLSVSGALVFMAVLFAMTVARLRRAEAALGKSRARYRELLRNAGSVIRRLRGDGRRSSRRALRSRGVRGVRTRRREARGNPSHGL
ncbi:MAG: hypothetical protein ABFD98_11305 [Syntrophobacteraceae bacterium]|nr:hypothetical protein [Desulfobacteraceae bacterium]